MCVKETVTWVVVALTLTFSALAVATSAGIPSIDYFEQVQYEDHPFDPYTDVITSCVNKCWKTRLVETLVDQTMPNGDVYKFVNLQEASEQGVVQYTGLAICSPIVPTFVVEVRKNEQGKLSGLIAHIDPYKPNVGVDANPVNDLYGLVCHKLNDRGPMLYQVAEEYGYLPVDQEVIYESGDIRQSILTHPTLGE